MWVIHVEEKKKPKNKPKVGERERNKMKQINEINLVIFITNYFKFQKKKLNFIKIIFYKKEINENN